MSTVTKTAEIYIVATTNNRHESDYPSAVAAQQRVDLLRASGVGAWIRRESEATPETADDGLIYTIERDGFKTYAIRGDGTGSDIFLHVHGKTDGVGVSCWVDSCSQWVTSRMSRTDAARLLRRLKKSRGLVRQK